MSSRRKSLPVVLLAALATLLVAAPAPAADDVSGFQLHFSVATGGVIDHDGTLTTLTGGAEVVVDDMTIRAERVEVTGPFLICHGDVTVIDEDRGIEVGGETMTLNFVTRMLLIRGSAVLTISGVPVTVFQDEDTAQRIGIDLNRNVVRLDAGTQEPVTGSTNRA